MLMTTHTLHMHVEKSGCVRCICCCVREAERGRLSIPKDVMTERLFIANNTKNYDNAHTTSRVLLESSRRHASHRRGIVGLGARASVVKL